MRAQLALPWDPALRMTDASPSGGALVEAPATTDELRAEGSWCSRTGWLVSRLLVAEGPAVGTPSAPVGTGQGDRGATQAVNQSLPTYRFLYLFAGRPYPHDLEFTLGEAAAEAGVTLILDAADLERHPPVDLLDRTTQEEILARARGGYWQG
eukprot:2444837-Lingulodinium_polyedra.AAC.1